MHADDNLEDISHHAENGSAQSPAALKKIKEDALNEKLDAEILENLDKMPKAVYFILPNECAERFCFYGLNPLLNPFFSAYLGMGKEAAFELTHAVSICSKASSKL